MPWRAGYWQKQNLRGRGRESRHKHVLASLKPVRVDVFSMEGGGKEGHVQGRRRCLLFLVAAVAVLCPHCAPLNPLHHIPLLFSTFVFGGTLFCLAHYSVVRFTASQMCRVLTARFCRIPWHTCGFSDNWGEGERVEPGRTGSGADGEEARRGGSRGTTPCMTWLNFDVVG